MSVDQHAIRQVLRQVKDPEVGPAGGQILSDADGVIRSLDGVTNVEVELVWEPLWTPDCIDPKVRAFMGY